MSEIPEGSIVLYQTDNGDSRIECRFHGETLWLSLNQISALFDRDKSVISKHLKNIFSEGELDPAATVAKYATVQTEGTREVTRTIEFYRLEAVFAVGYRVRSKRGVQFRAWATSKLSEFLQKGFVMDDEIGIVGYEIPFNRHFYEYQPPRVLAEIDRDLDLLSAEIMKLLRDVHS